MPQGLKSLRENRGSSVEPGGLTNHDASPGFAGSRRIGADAQDYVLGYFQPSLAGLFLALMSTQDCVLGYSQSSLRDWVAGGVLTQTLKPVVFSIVYGPTNSLRKKSGGDERNPLSG
jgi:hypothetical protein